MIRKNNFKFLFLIILSLFSLLTTVNAETTGTINSDKVNFRKGAGTGYSSYGYLYSNTTVTLVSTTLYSGTGCSAGWYNVYYEEKSGYICSTYIDIAGYDVYDRPWTTPKTAIVGGAKFITASYISKGQNTSYLKKFNVNPNGYYAVYNHQYMANLAAPASEASSSYTSYSENGLLSLALEFYIPVYDNMPDDTALPGTSSDTSGQDYVTDEAFEALLDAQGFPESYKRKLRALHEEYPNWVFTALHTGLDFYSAVSAEQSVSSISGSTSYYYTDSNGNYVSTESGWYIANTETVAYYLDPRNFLKANRILMFEDLGYSSNYTESTITSIISNTFMSGTSTLDNQTYSSIFIEAGQTADISAVYLASLARQESGVNGSAATTGAQFTYEGYTYIGFYNFFNIGASSSASKPIYAGLVYASKGAVQNSSGVYDGTLSISSSGSTSSDGNTSTGTTEQNVSVNDVISELGIQLSGSYLVGFELGMTVSELKAKTSTSITVSNSSGTTISGSELIATGMTIKISNTTYTVVVYGDLSGDGLVNSADLLKMRQYLLGTSLTGAYLEAAKVNHSDTVNSADLLLIRKHLLATQLISQS